MLFASVFVLHNFVKFLIINTIELNTPDTILGGIWKKNYQHEAVHSPGNSWGE